MRAKITGMSLLILIGLLLGYFLPVGSFDPPATYPLGPISEPLEDEPGWDCRTMGNKRCAPVTAPNYTVPSVPILTAVAP